RLLCRSFEFVHGRPAPVPVHRDPVLDGPPLVVQVRGDVVPPLHLPYTRTPLLGTRRRRPVRVSLWSRSLRLQHIRIRRTVFSDEEGDGPLGRLRRWTREGRVPHPRQHLMHPLAVHLPSQRGHRPARRPTHPV